MSSLRLGRLELYSPPPKHTHRQTERKVNKGEEKGDGCAVRERKREIGEIKKEKKRDKERQREMET